MKFVYRQRMALILAISTIVCISPTLANEEKHDSASLTQAVDAHVEAFGQPGVLKNVTQTVAITMTDAMRFQPGTLTFMRGETIRLRISNTGKTPHEFVLGTPKEIAEHAEMMRQMPGMTHTNASSVRLAPGKSADIVWQFSKPGKFVYACLIPGHWEAGMQGSMTVTE